MKITAHSIAYLAKIGIPWTSYVLGAVKHPDSKKITGMLHSVIAVEDVGQDDDGMFIKVNDPPRLYRDGTDIEIFLHDIPKGFFTFKPFDESNREYNTNAGELDRVKRLLATGLAVRNYASFNGWVIEGVTKIDDDLEVAMIFQHEGDALLAGSLFHEIISDMNTDFTAILPPQESSVPWLSKDDAKVLNQDRP